MKKFISLLVLLLFVFLLAGCVNDFFTSKMPYIEGTPFEVYEWQSLNGFEKAWYYVKNIDWWPFW